MRNISFFMTQQQIKDRIKDVTRRNNWHHAKPGMLLRGIVKGQGLKRGEKITKLAVIRVLKVSREPLNAITADEVRREGYPGKSPEWFIDFYIKGNKSSKTKITPETIITRIEFEYVEDAP